VHHDRRPARDHRHQPRAARRTGGLRRDQHKDLARIPDLVTDDFVDHGSPFPLPPGPEGYTQILTFVTRVLDFEYEIVDLFCTLDRIVVRSIAHGRAVAPAHGAQFAGRPYSMTTIQPDRMRPAQSVEVPAPRSR